MKKLLYILPVFIVTGCSSNTTTLAPTSNSAADSTSTSSAPKASTSANAPNTASDSPTTSDKSQPQVPAGMPMGAQVTLTPTPQLDAKIAQLAKGNNKKALANAYADRGTARMNDEPALPRIKYRAALVDYRQALQLDPTNVQAKSGQKLIEGIYRSMGRPVPQ